MGYGPPGIAKGVAKPAVVPGSPLLVTLTVVDSQTLRVFFNPPDSSGGDAVTEYMVELDSSSKFDSASPATEYRGHKFTSEFLGPVMYLGGGSGKDDVSAAGMEGKSPVIAVDGYLCMSALVCKTNRRIWGSSTPVNQFCV